MKKRIDCLDVAKGIAMFLVVMGHAALAYDTPYWRVAIYSFHMPLFFLVSGVVVGTVASVVGEAPHDLDEEAAKETFNGLMAVPNLIALLLLSGKLVETMKGRGRN